MQSAVSDEDPSRAPAERVILIDFEASGLGSGTWPIEVGLAWVEGTEIGSWSTLIRPSDTWDHAEWSEASAQLHNIPRDALEDAPDAVGVARDLLERIEGCVLVSDAPGFDGWWLSRLFDLIKAPRPRILDFDAVAAEMTTDRGLDYVYERLERTKTPHRAEGNAVRLARALLGGLKASEKADR
ncbi:hypothetical protein RM543_18855 [Roseicyclus sp. F158]|uniref:Exonuclease domain-containing protein n=1 Tax=Tropicimonas omnivorans TaxID=3075590 RepID=A0ABU3DM95_9RHOB|nr:exonuclease domain-containing protein [Roseicyclus sp. F158]MDT0684718.1 hypothetical protein [Roseicyclus sp. F158]